jgi:hypothetical protein
MTYTPRRDRLTLLRRGAFGFYGLHNLYFFQPSFLSLYFFFNSYVDLYRRVMSCWVHMTHCLYVTSDLTLNMCQLEHAIVIAAHALWIQCFKTYLPCSY